MTHVRTRLKALPARGARAEYALNRLWLLLTTAVALAAPALAGSVTPSTPGEYEPADKSHETQYVVASAAVAAQSSIDVSDETNLLLEALPKPASSSSAIPTIQAFASGNQRGLPPTLIFSPPADPDSAPASAQPMIPLPPAGISGLGCLLGLALARVARNASFCLR